MEAVELVTLRKSYGGNSVVRGLSLAVHEGEFLSLLGPSGCGKTTTLRMIAGLDRPDAGSIRLFGREVDGPGQHLGPEQRGLGMVFQSYAIWPNRTVAANVAYPLVLRGAGRTEIDRRVREALGWVRMEPFRDRLPHALSGGQLQRVALARALVASQKLLLLDEPLSNLDAALREELRAEIAAIRARLGTAMVYVTHDQAEALALSDRVAVMNKGVIEQLDRPEAVYADPATPFVASFVGGANLLEGTIGEAGFACEGQTFALPLDVSAARGPATIVVRPEDLELGTGGTELELAASLFLGSATEHRLRLGDRLIRAVASAPLSQRQARVGIRIKRAKVFRPAAPNTAGEPS